MFRVSLTKVIRKHTALVQGSDYPIRAVGLSNWEDHCVECSVPYCYSTCGLYQERFDGWCLRTIDGLIPNYNYKGILGYGIDVTFRKWAKLETYYYQKTFSLQSYRRVSAINNGVLKTLSRIYKIMPSVRFAKILFHSYQYRLLPWLIGKLRTTDWKPDIFLIECFLNKESPVRLLVQIDNCQNINYSRVFTLMTGRNEIRIPVSDIRYFETSDKKRVFVAPIGENVTTNIVFTYLNFIQMDVSVAIPTCPSAKVKVVAWDLDNTLWNGILSEDGEEKLLINQSALNLIKAFDERGILNTICSKNDYDSTMAVLRRMGIADLFLCPAINWGQKSENLKSIAERLNLGIDSFAFVDDNVRERQEVMISLPCVRVYSEKEIDSLLEKDEFKVLSTASSRNRRISYLNELKREELKELYSSNYDIFLRSLNMKLYVCGINESNFSRSLELLERTNQLNLRTFRYNAEELKAIISDNHFICLAFNCQDKFGDYGQVGFMSIKVEGTTAKILDFVISCRIAKKKVEEAMVQSAMQILKTHTKVVAIQAELVRTKKNKPLVDVFQTLPFELVAENANQIVYVMSNIKNQGKNEIINIDINYRHKV